MKTTQVLPLAVLASVAAALVIPNVSNNQEVFAIKQEVKESPEAAVATEDSVIDTALLKEHLSDEPAPIVLSGTVPNNMIPHRYIIVFKKGILQEEIEFHKNWVSQEHIQAAKALLELNPTAQFFSEVRSESIIDSLGGLLDSFHIDGLFAGYFGYFLDDTIELIRRNPLVQFVEQDSKVFSYEFNTQNGAPWGLSRISHRDALNLGSFNKYLYDDNAGEGVTSYVIDTGVNVEHSDFEGRATWGKTIPAGDPDEDGNGHGTHCAGTIGSKHYGVAKKADIVAVKVLRSNGSGTMSDVVKGVEYAANAHAQAVKNGKKGFKGSTANMSLGGGKSPSLDMAVNAAVQVGIHFAVAAGNDNADACNYSPASAEKAVTVGASTLSDTRAYFSNYGKCVDIFGPGLNILSTYIGSKTATATLSGTSMASPHVAGLLTYYLSLQPGVTSEFGAKGGITPAQLKKKIIDYSSKDKLTDIPDGTPNYLIYNGGGQNLSEFWSSNASEAEESNVKYAINVAFEKFEHAADQLVKEFKDFVSINF